MVSQSFAMASHSPGILDSRDGSAQVQGAAMPYICRYSVNLLWASEPVPGSDQPGRNADWMIGGDLRRASGRADHRAVPVPALPALAVPLKQLLGLAPIGSIGSVPQREAAVIAAIHT